MCRAVEATRPARPSWLQPRCSRHRRSRTPNGLLEVCIRGVFQAPAGPAIPWPGIAFGAADDQPGSMPKLTTHLRIAAPADRVWDVIGPGFAGIGDWATAIPASRPVASPSPTTPSLDGPAARVCSTGIRLLPEITEAITAYDDAGRTLTYEAAGMPAFVVTARNTWTVEPIDEHACRVRLTAQFDTAGFLGWLGRRAILAQARRTSRHLAQ